MTKNTDMLGVTKTVGHSIKQAAPVLGGIAIGAVGVVALAAALGWREICRMDGGTVISVTREMIDDQLNDLSERHRAAKAVRAEAKVGRKAAKEQKAAAKVTKAQAKQTRRQAKTAKAEVRAAQKAARVEPMPDDVPADA